jgi:glycosyltransferase involved in cell wall biosynthesis
VEGFKMLTVVVPIFNEQENIPSFHATLARVLQDIPEQAEVIYVDDGSCDSSLYELLEVQKRDSRVSVVELSRNFGHQAALTAGMSTARGDAIVLMDGDFQDPPELLPDLVAAWRRGAKVVIANRRSRADRGLRGRLFPVFYKVMSWLSDYPIPLDAGIFGLMDRQVLDAVNRLQENNRYLPGMRAWVGFPTAFVSYDRADRAAGEPKQTFRRLFKYAMDAIFSFSYKPLRLGLFLGVAILGLSVLLATLAVIATMADLKFFGRLPGEGSIAVLLAVLFVGGVQLICTGLLGEYIGRVYDEVRRRPLFVVHQVHRAEVDKPLRSDQERELIRSGSAA